MAPMVRISTLPSRLVAKDYGCRLAYSEEIIAKKLINTSRYISPTTGLIYFNEDNKNNQKSTAKALVTYPHERLSVQLGVSNGVDAVQAASVVARDARAIDINMGCPKLFSLQGAMGAALLTEPETVRDIVTSLRRNINLPITCKIRMLADPRHSVELIRMLESIGVTAIGVHARYREDRPRFRALPFEQMRLLSSSVQIPILYNGDVFSLDDIDRYRGLTRCSSVLIARGAMWNYSIFNYDGYHSSSGMYKKHLKSLKELQTPDILQYRSPNDPFLGLINTSSSTSREYPIIKSTDVDYLHGTIESIKGHSYDWGWSDDEYRNKHSFIGTKGMMPLYDVVKKYIDYAIQTENAIQNSKYVITEMLKGHKLITSNPSYQLIHGAKSYDDMKKGLEELCTNKAMTLQTQNSYTYDLSLLTTYNCGKIHSTDNQNIQNNAIFTNIQYTYKLPHHPHNFVPRPLSIDNLHPTSKKHKTEIKILSKQNEKGFTLAG